MYPPPVSIVKASGAETMDSGIQGDTVPARVGRAEV